MDVSPKFLTVGEVARFLRVRPQTVYLWASRKRIPSQKIGYALRFDRAALNSWLEKQKREESAN